MNTEEHEAIRQLMAWAMGGAVLGAILTVVAGAIGALLYAFRWFGITYLFAPPVWLLAIVWGTVAAVSWTPLGAVIGSAAALYRLHTSKGISNVLVYSAVGVLLVAGLALLGLRFYHRIILTGYR